MAKPKVSSTSFLYSIKVVKAIINLNSDLDNIVGDVIGDTISDIVEIDLILNWLAYYLT